MSTPDEALDGWQNGGDQRSSWSILWNCLTTIFACTWTVLHLNVPPRGTTYRQEILRKVRWLIITALAPELVTSYAFGDYLHAKGLLKALKEVGFACPDWKLAHGFYLSMGALNLKTIDGWEIQCCSYPHTGDGWQIPSYNPTLVKLVISRTLEYPEITSEDISDRNKADGFSKGIAILQSTWFLVNAIARAMKGLPICPLELSCMAYIGCTCVTYYFWLHKPKDISTVLIIPCPITLADVPDDLQDSVRAFDPLSSLQCHHRWRKLNLPITEAEVMNVVRGRMPAIMGLVVGVTFCCIHIIAWNFEFPSDTERIMWRTSAVGSATVPLLAISMVGIRRLGPATFDALWAYVFALYCSIIVFYATARFTLIVIMFSTMRDLPRGSFIGINWAHFIPHV